MTKRSYQDKVVFITGASAGIGEALAREAAARGASLVLLARRQERLAELAAELSATGTKVVVTSGDVCADGEVERAVERGRTEFGRLDVVIANAGFGVAGKVEDLSIDDYRRQFETNVFGVLRTVKAALPELKKQRGRIGIVGSTNGFVSLPGWSAYCMSKHAVRSLCASLTLELFPSGVSVTHLAPGFIASEFRQVRNDGVFVDGAVDPVPRWLQMPARAAARQMLSAIERRKAEQVITKHARLAIELERFAPALVSRVLRMSSGLMEMPDKVRRSPST